MFDTLTALWFLILVFCFQKSFRSLFIFDRYMEQAICCECDSALIICLTSL